MPLDPDLRVKLLAHVIARLAGIAVGEGREQLPFTGQELLDDIVALVGDKLDDKYLIPLTVEYGVAMVKTKEAAEAVIADADAQLVKLETAPIELDPVPKGIG